MDSWARCVPGAGVGAGAPPAWRLVFALAEPHFNIRQTKPNVLWYDERSPDERESG